MVLAAGLGTRMRPLTDDRPKALVEVGGKALIDHMLDRLAEAGVERAVVNVHAFADRLEAHLARRARPARSLISDERAALLETGGGIEHAARAAGRGADLGGQHRQRLDRGRRARAAGPGATPGTRRGWTLLLLLAPRGARYGFDGPEGLLHGRRGPPDPLRRRADPSRPSTTSASRSSKPAAIYDRPARRRLLASCPIWMRLQRARGGCYGAVMDGLLDARRRSRPRGDAAEAARWRAVSAGL